MPSQLVVSARVLPSFTPAPPATLLDSSVAPGAVSGFVFRKERGVRVVVKRKIADDGTGRERKVNEHANRGWACDYFTPHIAWSLELLLLGGQNFS